MSDLSRVNFLTKKDLDPLSFLDRLCINAGMANLSSAFQDALADQAKAALVTIVAENPKTTVRDLKDLISDNPALGSLTLSELLGGSRGSGRKAAPQKAKPAARSAGPVVRKGGGGAAAAASGGGGGAGGGAAHKRNVRTESGRETFDQEVLEALKAQGGDTVAATQLRESIDAEPTQLRTALNRLIERGLVTFTGKARGTRYSLA
jgi:hypothetical protein